MIKLEEPDGGRAWVVAVASAMITMILAGLNRVSGLLYVAIIKTYSVSREDATLPFTIRNAIRCLSGPVVGVVGQRYGVRAVAFWGGVIATIGVALCWIAPNIIWLTVFWGGIYGLGFAAANTLYKVVINEYFEKYRATASCIALSGSCIGSFLLPVITEHILNTYGLSDGFLIIAGIVMHVLPPALLLKSPLWMENPEEYARLKSLKMKQKTLKTIEKNIPDSSGEEVDKEEQWSDRKQSKSLNNGPVVKLNVYSRNRKLKDKTEKSTKFTVNNFWRKEEKELCENNVICTFHNTTDSVQLNRRNSSLSDSNMPIEISDGFSIRTISGNLTKQKCNIDSTDPTERTPKVSPGNKASLLESIRGITILYTNPGYVLVDFSLAIYTIIFIPVVTVIIDYSIDKGIHESYGKYIINCIGIGNLIGRLCFGWVTDKKFLSIPIFMAVDFILQGVFLVLLPLVTDVYLFILILVFHGVTESIIVVHMSILVMLYVDTHLQSVAMGCKEFFSGVISFAVPPMIGHFRDHIGSYDGMFYLLGVISVVTGGIWFLEPLLLKLHSQRSVEEEAAKEEEMKTEQPSERF